MLRCVRGFLFGSQLPLAGRLRRHDPRHGPATPRHDNLGPGLHIPQDARELLIGLPRRHGFLHDALLRSSPT